MKTAFSFIKHGILRREFEETLRQVHARGDVIQSWNGIVIMEHPLPGIGTFSVSSEKLIKAIEICDWKPSVTVDKGSVLVKKGKTTIRIQLDSAPPDLQKAKGDKVQLPENFMQAINLVRPFVSEDASRNWACQIKVHGGFMYATNNIVIIRTPIAGVPDAVIPIEMVSVLQKVKDIPKTLIMGKSQIRFNYGNKAWAQCRLHSAQWPAFTELFDKFPKVVPAFPANLSEVINNLASFCEDDIISVADGVASTSEAKIKGVSVPNCTGSAQHFKRVVGAFTHGDFSGPLFYLRGKNVEGLMASIK